MGERERERGRKKRRRLNGAVRNGTTAAVIGNYVAVQSAELQGDATVITPQKKSARKETRQQRQEKVESGEICVSSMIFQ